MTGTTRPLSIERGQTAKSITVCPSLLALIPFSMPVQPVRYCRLTAVVVSSPINGSEIVALATRTRRL